MDNQSYKGHKVGGSGRSMCVYITTPNEEFIKREASKVKGRHFSTALNEIIDERRYNAEFDYCQNEF